MNFENEYTISVPKFKEGVLVVDLTLAKAAENRMQEASYVNRSTAQELMNIFVQARTNVKDSVVKARYELALTSDAIDKRRGILILEVCPEEAIKRGIATKASPSGSEDFRNSIIVSDSQYQSLLEKSNMLRATIEYLNNKAEAFLMTYQQIKKIYSPDEPEYHGLNSENSSGAEGVGLSRY